MRAIGGVSGIGAPLPPNRLGGDNFIRYIGDRLILDFHEGAGMTVRDLSGWGNDLTLTGNQGWRLGSFYLDGSSYFSILDASQAGLDMGFSDFMVEVRIKLTMPLTSQPDVLAYLFSKYALGTAYYEGYLLRDEEIIRFAIADTLGGVWADYSASYADDLNWHSLSFVADRNSVAGLKLFIDGVEVAYVDATSVDDLDNSGELAIGTEATTHNFKLDSQIDGFRIWNFGTRGPHIGPVGILRQYLYHKWNTN